jgi:ATP-dependent 26S proteasome regulatory subunit
VDKLADRSQLPTAAALADAILLARECALLGAYGSALQHFARAAGGLAQRARAAADGAERARWALERDAVDAEAALVRELVRELSVFRSPPGAAAAAAAAAAADGGAGEDYEDGADAHPGGARAGARGHAAAAAAAPRVSAGGARGARGRGPAFQHAGGDGKGGDEGDEDSGGAFGGGGGGGGGRWSPPPPRVGAPARASSVGPVRGADVPAWERPLQPRPAGAGAGSAAVMLQRPGVVAGGGSGRGAGSAGAGGADSARRGSGNAQLLPPGGAAAAATGAAAAASSTAGAATNAAAAAAAGARTKQVMKAPLPVQAKPSAARGGAAGAGAGGGGRGAAAGAAAAASAAASAAAGGGGGAVPPGSAGAGGGGARLRYCDAHPDAVDRELIARLEGEVLTERPNVRFADIAGLHDAKTALNTALVLPMIIPGYFTGGLRQAWKGVLLFGPPGTGKTMLAKAVATECRMTFINVSASSLASKWRGEGEKLVRILFELARFYAPTVIFFDEVDSVAAKGNSSENDASTRMRTELLVRMDGISSDAAAAEAAGAPQAGAGVGGGGGAGAGAGGEDGEDSGGEGGAPRDAASAAARRTIMVLGATNQPWELDDGIKRRFQKRIFIPLPGPAERRALLQLQLASVLVGADVDVDALVARLESYSGADIRTVCQAAALAPLERLQAELQARHGLGEAFVRAMQEREGELKRTPVTRADLEEAIAKNKPSSGSGSAQRFADYAREHGSN